MEMTGFSREAFYTLKNVLFSVDRNDHRLGGRPRSLDATGELRPTIQNQNTTATFHRFSFISSPHFVLVYWDFMVDHGK